ncbi:IclR family transcriptional regulator [Lacisediminimonas profundi]|uniref:IclR family transcriptional regulator n=1 Tax=Lacisediminimonas profundi TaxID=2603856 RepID=UPI00124B73D6|nr:IclR family transcriptional regulator [Lacisediminimonas profundi]
MNNTLLKGLEVLELLAYHPRPLGITEIAGQTGLAKSNVHRVLQALVAMRYVIRDETARTYSPSIKLWELGSAVLSRLDLKQHAQPAMQRLLEQAGETVHLSVLDGDEVVYVHKLDSDNPIRAYTEIGGRALAHCVATGKAMLAFQPDEDLERRATHLARVTPATITDPAKFMKEMLHVRECGYAVNCGEWRDSVHGVAAPVRDATGNVIAAIGLSGPADRFKQAQRRIFAGLVVAAARAVSASLSGAP